MPGNTTSYTGVREFLPVFWKQDPFTSGQTTAVSMVVPGFPSGMVGLPLARRSSIVSVGIVLTQALTNGFLRFQLTMNGSPLGPTADIVPANGTKRLWELPPGRLVGAKGDVVGVQWGSNPAMAPSNSVSGVVFVESEPA